MKKTTSFGGTLALLGALAAALPAQAAIGTPCSNTMFTDDTTVNPGYKTCFPIRDSSKNIIFDSSLTEISTLNSNYRLAFQRMGLSSDGSPGSSSPFASILNPVLDLSSGLLTAGQLELVAPRSDYFVIGLQATDLTTRKESLVFYQFNYTGLAATKTIYFDTLGFDNRLATLERAALYLPMLAVPEPASWATTLLGLGLLASVRRRRRS